MDNGEHYKHEDDMVWVFGKIYRRAFLDGYHIEFNDTRANEDNGFNTVICLLSENVKTMSGVVTYYWHWNKNSITRNNDYAYNGMEGFINNQIWAYDKVMQYPTVVKKRKDIIMDRFVRVFIQLYVYYVEFAVTRDSTLDYLLSCQKYYNEVFSKIEPELTQEYFNQCYTNVVTGNDIMTNYIPVCTIYQFIETLRREIKID